MHFLSILTAEGGGGFNPLDLAAGGNVLWTLVIFVVALPFMWKVVMGPVSRALEERDGHLVRAIGDAERASSEAERARAEVEVLKGEMQAEAAKVLAEARQRAEVREQQIVEAARSEAAGMVEAARKTIRAEQDKAVAAIRKEVVELSLDAAGKVLQREVKSDDTRRLVSELVRAEPARS